MTEANQELYNLLEEISTGIVIPKAPGFYYIACILCRVSQWSYSPFAAMEFVERHSNHPLTLTLFD